MKSEIPKNSNGFEHQQRIADFIADALWCNGKIKCADVIVSLPCGQFPVHKLVVGAHSRILCQIYLKDPDLSFYDLRTSQYDYVTKPTFNQILKYMYTGDCDFSRCDPRELSRVIQDFFVIGLVEDYPECEPFEKLNQVPPTTTTEGYGFGKVIPTAFYSKPTYDDMQRQVMPMQNKFASMCNQQPSLRDGASPRIQKIICQTCSTPYTPDGTNPPGQNAPRGMVSVGDIFSMDELRNISMFNNTNPSNQTNFNPLNTLISHKPVPLQQVMPVMMPPVSNITYPTKVYNAPKHSIRDNSCCSVPAPCNFTTTQTFTPRYQNFVIPPPFKVTPSRFGDWSNKNSVCLPTLQNISPAMAPTFPGTMIAKANSYPSPQITSYNIIQSPVKQPMFLQDPVILPIQVIERSIPRNMSRQVESFPTKVSTQSPQRDVDEKKPIKLVDRRLYQNLSVENFLNLTYREIILLLSDDDLAIENEIEAFISAWRWLYHDRWNRWCKLRDVLQCIRFPLMTVRQLLVVAKEMENISEVYDFIINASWYHTCLQLMDMDKMFYEIPKPRKCYGLKRSNPFSIYLYPRDMKIIPALKDWRSFANQKMLPPNLSSSNKEEEAVVSEIVNNLKDQLSPTKSSEDCMERAYNIYDKMSKNNNVETKRKMSSPLTIEGALEKLKMTIKELRSLSDKLDTDARNSISRLKVTNGKKITAKNFGQKIQGTGDTNVSLNKLGTIEEEIEIVEKPTILIKNSDLGKATITKKPGKKNTKSKIVNEKMRAPKIGQGDFAN